jgi:hypothetical protein
MARAEPHTRFTSLMGMLFDPEGLRESFERQDGRKAPGVDGVRKDDYAVGLDARLEDLSARIRRLGYRPLPVRRTYIPKGDGRYRPLGVPTTSKASCRAGGWERGSGTSRGVIAPPRQRRVNLAQACARSTATTTSTSRLRSSPLRS